MASPPWEAAVKEGKKLDVVIIGGSLAGLMHGIMLKRHGHNVRLLEQNTSSTRTDHGAGIGTGPLGLDFHKIYDLYPTPYSFSSPGFHFLDKNANIKRQINTPLNLTSWNVLYYRLRANFDGLTSDYCPEPIKFPESDGQALYDLGKSATDVFSTDQLATVEYHDLKSSRSSTVHADLVIIADGQNSIFRKKFMPAEEEEPQYSGYVVWRGTVPESSVSESTKNLFSNHRFLIFQMLNAYIGGYIIPGPSGSLTPGTRSLNYIWYSALPSSLPTLKAILTDTSGHTHRNTLPMGAMRPDIWSAQVAYAKKHMCAPFAELVAKTTSPFVSTVRSRSSSHATALNGKAMFVGEALTLMRPNTGMSFNHSAFNCLQLEKIIKGEEGMDLRGWEREGLEWGEWNGTLAAVVGEYGVKGVWSWAFVWILVRLVWVSGRLRLGRLRVGRLRAML
ncbi:MAG: hypothetical protein Q9166_001127 [cf. Caloplaca sp. 2 TL-2023]